ncbi:MAG: hypothetical protein EP329_22170 [Deltaproteobacteria bacterium]|nr:MAG: hypothetical protein EP329_22170 [Deltaproteobacteria bacterium]
MLDALWHTTLALAPWLLLGLVAAAALHVLVPRSVVRRRFTGPSGVLRAVALGVPLPLCSCSVIPAGIGLKRSGASDGAAMGFMISTPQTGVDSVLVSASLLGWPFALLKVAAALVTGVVGGLWIERVGGAAGSGAAVAEEPVAPRTWAGALDHALDILGTIWPWLAVGVGVSAAIEVFVPVDALAALSGAGGLWAALAALVVSLPLYVCATGSVPIAAALVGAGLPLGAALVFLMAGPATNLATIGAVYRTFGGRRLAVYLAVIVVGSVGFGLGFDAVLGSEIAAVAGHAEGPATWWELGSTFALLAAVAWLAAGDARRWWGRLATRSAAGQAVVLTVDGMTCGHCALKVETAARGVPGVAAVTASVDERRLVVKGAMDEDALRQAVEAAGFTIQR